MSRAARWWLLSDLHLGVSDEDPRRPGTVLPEFLHREVAWPRLLSITDGDPDAVRDDLFPYVNRRSGGPGWAPILDKAAFLK